MVPDTHFLFNTEEVRPKERSAGYDLDRKSTTIQAKKGSCILFDFRLKHRGLGNNSQKPRPLMYITYCVPSYKDTMNFNTRRYLTLPKLEEVASRSDRAGKRSEEEAELLLDQAAREKVARKLGGRDEPVNYEGGGGGMLEHVVHHL